MTNKKTLKPGIRVHHAKFGEGVVLQMEGTGAMERVQVNFKQFGVKWLMLAYAKLEITDGQQPIRQPPNLTSVSNTHHADTGGTNTNTHKANTPTRLLFDRLNHIIVVRGLFYSLESPRLVADCLLARQGQPCPMVYHYSAGASHFTMPASSVPAIPLNRPII